MLNDQKNELRKQMQQIWTPLKDRKPDEGTCLIVTIWDSIRCRKELRYPVYYRQSFYSEHYGFYLYADEGDQLLPEYSKVLAWMEVPEVWDGEVPDALGANLIKY